MDFLHKSPAIVALALCGVLATGVSAVNSAHAAEEKPAAAQNAQPVTDCFESRIGYSSVTRVENADPKYGYPNVKCSQTTGAVLWWGDPFDGTIPMGEMPDISDSTRGDFDHAVVKPREPQLQYFNMGPNGCETCHNGKMVPFPKDSKPRLIGMHQDIVENSLKLMHGRGALWCLNCHSATHRNHLIDRQGNEISFNQPQKLCGGCHGENYIDWRAGVHGKRIGSWATGGKKRWWVCTECHNPHTVQKARFNQLKPESPPPLPRGMKNADYERAGDAKH
ncbi:MAG: hypothetical protein HY306_05540 [Nitrosomonadales bacterium]|nr:hypothetical protein [Nitrosomonadales bacterium]